MKQKTEWRPALAKLGCAGRRLLAGTLAALVLCAAVPFAHAQDGAAAQESTSLPVAGQTYWFNLEGVTTNQTGLDTVKNNFPAGLKWMPMIFSGTIEAYVMKQGAPGNWDSTAAASVARSKEDYEYGWQYPHQVFIATHLATRSGYNWNWIGDKGDKVIYGKDHTVGGITYTLRSPSGGKKKKSDGAGVLDNAEWTVLWDKGFIKNSNGSNYSATQNWSVDSYGNNTVTYMYTRTAGAYMGPTQSDKDLGWRPLLEVPQGKENSLHAVALDFGNFKLTSHEGYTGSEVKTMNVVMAEGSSNITRPAYEELTWLGDGEAPKKENLAWLADNGKLYAMDAEIPVAGIKSLTLVAPGITITAQPQSVTVEEGEAATFTVEASAGNNIGALSYEWQVKAPASTLAAGGEGEWENAGSSNRYTVDNVTQAMDGTQYRCKVMLTYSVTGTGGAETQKTIEVYSDAATLTVKEKHTVTVNNGTGGGKYAEGESVTLTANDRPGYRFTGWTLEGVTVADAAQKQITFNMPGNDVTATANYAELFTVTVNGGTVTGGTASGTTSSQFAAGEEVTITAAEAEGQAFTGWQFTPELTLTEGTAADKTVKFTMPQSNVVAVAGTQQLYQLTVNGAEGSGWYAPGTVVTLTAKEQEGKRFQKWTFTPESIGFIEGGVDSATVKFTMPAEAVTAEAGFTQLYTVTVENGTLVGRGRETTGQYAEGDTVSIQADDIAQKRFQSWTFTPDSVQVTDPGMAATTFIMPGQHVTATANHVQVYTVTVAGGTGGGQYAAGDRVTLTAEVPAGHKFDGWMFSPEVSFLDGTNAGSATVVFTMPEGGVTAKAVTSAQASDTPAPAPGASGQKPNPKTGADGWQAFWQGVRDLLGL